MRIFQTAKILSLGIFGLYLTACNNNSDAPFASSETPDVTIVCTAPALADISNPDHVVGDGSAASCTESALREALEAGGVVTCNCGSDPVTISVSSEIVITQDVVLDGGGTVTLSGNNTSRILKKESGADLTVQNITFQQGKAPSQSGFSFNECGGAILARSHDTGQAVGGNFTAINVNFKDNTTGSLDENDVAGGAVYVFNVPRSVFANCTFTNNRSSNGGAIGNLGSDLVVINSVFNDNIAQGVNGFLTGHGGAINIDGVSLSGQNREFTLCGCQFNRNEATKQGGAVNGVVTQNRGVNTLFDRCSFDNNQTTSNESGQGGAVFFMEDDDTSGEGSGTGSFRVLNTTFSNNSVYSQGGGLWTLMPVAGFDAINCTFANNETRNNELGMGGGLAISNGPSTVTNCTFAYNYAWFHGGGIQAGGDKDVTLSNCIFYENTSTREFAGYNTNSELIDGGNNIQFPVTYGKIVTATEINEDPLLGNLADNGGPTRTIALPSNSPAVNAGNAATAPTTDQRGENRDSQPDIGAYELLP